MFIACTFVHGFAKTFTYVLCCFLSISDLVLALQYCHSFAEFCIDFVDVAWIRDFHEIPWIAKGLDVRTLWQFVAWCDGFRALMKRCYSNLQDWKRRFVDWIGWLARLEGLFGLERQSHTHDAHKVGLSETPAQKQHKSRVKAFPQTFPKPSQTLPTLQRHLTTKDKYTINDTKITTTQKIRHIKSTRSLNDRKTLPRDGT